MDVINHFFKSVCKEKASHILTLCPETGKSFLKSIRGGKIVKNLEWIIKQLLNFEINISDKKSRRFDLSEVIFKCIKVL